MVSPSHPPEKRNNRNKRNTAAAPAEQRLFATADDALRHLAQTVGVVPKRVSGDKELDVAAQWLVLMADGNRKRVRDAIARAFEERVSPRQRHDWERCFLLGTAYGRRKKVRSDRAAIMSVVRDVCKTEDAQNNLYRNLLRFKGKGSLQKFVKRQQRALQRFFGAL